MPLGAKLLRGETLQTKNDLDFLDRVLEIDGQDGKFAKPRTSIRRTYLTVAVYGVHKCMGQLYDRVRVKCFSKCGTVTPRSDQRIKRVSKYIPRETG